MAKGVAPPGAALVTTARYHRPEDADMDHETSKSLLFEHAARAGIVEADITMERYLHRVPVTWGLPLAAAGGLAGRPSPAVPGHPGLFVAGDWVGERGLLADAAAASATEAMAHIAAVARPASATAAATKTEVNAVAAR